MKSWKSIVMVVVALMTCALARAGSVTMITDLEADTAVTVTGPAQSNAIAQAAAHLLRTDNPHAVTAAQIGALTEEADTLDSVASRWPVSTHEFTIKPQDDLYPFVTLSQAYVSILASAHNTMAITTNRIFFTEDDETSAWNFRRTPGDYHVAATEDLVTKADASTALVINGIRGSSGTGGVWNIETSSIQTNDVDDRVRLLAPTNSPTFTGAITWNGNTQSSWPIGVSASTVTQIVASAAVTNRLWYPLPWAGDALSLGVFRDSQTLGLGATSTAVIAVSRIPVEVDFPVTVRYTVNNNMTAGASSTNIAALVLYNSYSIAQAVRVVGGCRAPSAGTFTCGVTYRPAAGDAGAYLLKIFAINTGSVTNGTVRMYNDFRWSPATAGEILAAGL